MQCTEHHDAIKIQQTKHTRLGWPVHPGTKHDTTAKARSLRHNGTCSRSQSRCGWWSLCYDCRCRRLITANVAIRDAVKQFTLPKDLHSKAFM